MVACPTRNICHNILKNINIVSFGDGAVDENNGNPDGNRARHFMRPPNDRQVASDD
jgi:hypothetical protein